MCRNCIKWAIVAVSVALPWAVVLQGERGRGEAQSRQWQTLFDGQSLSGWDGDPAYWRVEGGAITGQTTPDRPLPHNTFIVWRGGQVADFELELEFRVEGPQGWANSGIQYRSKELPQVGRWVLGGYQADIDLTKRYIGILYEERGRGILALRGQKVIIEPLDRPRKRRLFRRRVVGQLGDPEQLVAELDPTRWNRYRIVARDNRLAHYINGRQMVAVEDRDERHAARRGLLGLQLHQGKPMKVQFRNIRLREL